MEEQLIIKFYSEEFKCSYPKFYGEFILTISNILQMKCNDVKELIIYYLLNGEKIFINNSNAFINFKNKEIKEIYIEINEESNLYKEEKKNLEENVPITIKNIQNLFENQLSKLKTEILEQSKLLLTNNENNNNNNKYNTNIILNAKNNLNLNQNIIHEGVECINCMICPIKGIRYHCLMCTHYNLCENCEEKMGFSHPHNLLKMRYPIKKKKTEKKTIKKGIKKNTNSSSWGRNKKDDSSEDIDNCFY